MGDIFDYNTPDIVSAGPFVLTEGFEPRRIVLRQGVDGAAYTVQQQVVPDPNRGPCPPYFCTPEYFADRASADARFAQWVDDLNRE